MRRDDQRCRTGAGLVTRVDDRTGTHPGQAHPWPSVQPHLRIGCHTHADSAAKGMSPRCGQQTAKVALLRCATRVPSVGVSEGCRVCRTNCDPRRIVPRSVTEATIPDPRPGSITCTICGAKEALTCPFVTIDTRSAGEEDPRIS